jgi:hypothetical protein
MSNSPDHKSILDQFSDDHPDLKPDCGCSVGRGWELPVLRALEQLVALSRETGIAIKAGQIKEKFGGLRMYVQVDAPAAPDDEFELVDPVQAAMPTPNTRFRVSAWASFVRGRARAIIDAAEEAFAVLCETCGAPGHLRNLSGYWCTRCQACADAALKRS